MQPSPGPAPGRWSETGQPAAGRGLVCRPAQPSSSSDGRAEQSCGETRGAAELTEEARLTPGPPDPQAPALTPESQPDSQASGPSTFQPESQGAGWLAEGQGPLQAQALLWPKTVPSLPFLVSWTDGTFPAAPRQQQRWTKRIRRSVLHCEAQRILNHLLLSICFVCVRSTFSRQKASRLLTRFSLPAAPLPHPQPEWLLRTRPPSEQPRWAATHVHTAWVQRPFPSRESRTVF